MKRIPVSSIKTKAQHVAAHRKMWTEVIGIIRRKQVSDIFTIKYTAFNKYFTGNLTGNCWGCNWDDLYGICLFYCNCYYCCNGAWDGLYGLNCITDNKRALFLARKILNMKIRGSK